MGFETCRHPKSTTATIHHYLGFQLDDPASLAAVNLSRHELLVFYKQHINVQDTATYWRSDILERFFGAARGPLPGESLPGVLAILVRLVQLVCLRSCLHNHAFTTMGAVFPLNQAHTFPSLQLKVHFRCECKKEFCEKSYVVALKV